MDSLEFSKKTFRFYYPDTLKNFYTSQAHDTVFETIWKILYKFGHSTFEGVQGYEGRSLQCEYKQLEVQTYVELK